MWTLGGIMGISKKFYVIFLDSLVSDGKRRLTVANKEFGDWPAAKRYADSVHSSYTPQVVSGFGGGFPNIKKVSSND